MNANSLRSLAEAVLEMEKKATKGPWHARMWMEGEGTGSVSGPHGQQIGRIHSSAFDQELIAATRTSAPQLARAVIALLPFVEHKRECPKWRFDADIAEKYGQGCRCGLDAALKEIGV